MDHPRAKCFLYSVYTGAYHGLLVYSWFTCKGLYLSLALRHGNPDAYVRIRCRAHAQKIGSREAECMLARTNLPLDDIRYDVTITHIERPDCLYIQRFPPTGKDPGFSDDADPTLEAAAEELQTLEEIMAKINEPDYFKKYTPLTTASDGKWALCPK